MSARPWVIIMIDNLPCFHRSQSDADLSAKLLQLISQAGKSRNGGQEIPEKGTSFDIL